MLRISGVSSYPGFELTGSNCIENSTPEPRGMQIWFEITGVRVIRVLKLPKLYCSYTLAKAHSD